MAERPDDDNSEDPGRASDDRTDPFTALGGSSSRMSPTGTEVKSEGKRKKFRPLDVVRKLFKRRPKLKEIDSARARSTSALYGHASGEGEEDDEEGGFLSRISLRKNKSRSEDSVLVEARTNQTGILRKLAYSVEGINKSIYSSNSGKSSSRNSLNSTESQEHFKEGLKGRRSSVENSEPSVDLEAVAKTEALNTDAAKFKISVRPKGRKGSRQSRKSRQKVASNLPCLNEEQQTFTSPSLNKDDVEEIPPKVETEIFPPKEEITEPVAKKKREQRIPLEDLPPKPRPKSTPVTIHSTEETHQISNTVFDLESAEGSKHLVNPELHEFGKIRSKSLDIEGKGQRYLDFSLSPVKKSNLVPKSSKDDTETTDKYAKSNRKGLEIKDLEISVKKDTKILQKEPKPDSEHMELDEECVKVYRNYEKGVDVGLDSQKSLLSPNFGDKSLRPMKSPISLDLGVKVDDEEKSQKPLKSPAGSLDLGLKSIKSPIQTPSLESKSMKDASPTRSSDLESRALMSLDSEDEIKSPKTPPVLVLKPLKIPIQATDFPSGFSKSLPSPVKQDNELRSPKSVTKSTEENIIEISDSQESIQKHLKSSKQPQDLAEETSKQVNQTYSLTKENQNEEQKGSLLEAPNTENEDKPKSPKKIIASLELGNLTTKPLRSFSDPKSPRSSLRSPNLSPRSPILPPKPIRSPLGSPSLVGLDTKSPVKSFELPKLVSKLENTSESYENLHSKSPQSPLIAPKSFTLMSKSLKSPSTEGKSPNEIPALVSKPLKEHSEVANVGELNSAKRVSERPDLEQKNSSDTSSFSDLISKPLKKVLIEQNSGQKLSKSPSDSSNLEDSCENPFLKSINLEPKSPKPDFTESTKDFLLKSTNLESKPLKTSFEDSNQNPLKKSLEKPSLGPKPLKSPVEAPNMGPKLNLSSNKMNKNNKTTEIQLEVEECKSQVGKNLEIFEAIGKKDNKIALTSKISTGSKVTTLVSMADSSTSSSIPEKSKMPEKSGGIATSSKSGTGSSMTPSKTKMADSSNITTPSKVVNTFKMADTSNITDKPKVVTGGFKMMESSKMDSGSIVYDKPKIASTSKIPDSSNIAETSKITTVSSNTVVKLDDSSPKDPEPKLAPTTKITDSCKISDSSKVIATPTKNDSSKHSKEPFSDEVNTVATSSKMTVDSPTKTTTKVVSEPAKQSLAPKLKSFEQTSSAANEIAGSGIDVTQNNTNRLSALFEAKSVAASHVDPGTTVKIEVIAKDDSSEQKTVKLREKGKSTEKISELSSRQSKVLDLVKNFQKLQAT